MRRRRLLLIASGTAGVLLAYPTAGLLGGAIPSNGTWAPPERGITLFVESNGVHTGIVMPKVAAGVDLRRAFPPGDLADPRYAAHDHVSVGWGERDFYLETPTWADLKVSTVVAATISGPTRSRSGPTSAKPHQDAPTGACARNSAMASTKRAP